ncbi:hypothetical protein E2C01_006517 [Portunus trituberculatus]|uniref:Uncharacterized protein n=1 Tax=Portunus trituberculatus TaxID=210409 RepID=A0A5B7D218_PORTR|nr:hypothetical protein [Portunus trituberculatus]
MWKEYVEEMVEVVEEQHIEVVEQQHVQVVEEQHEVEYCGVKVAPPNEELSPTLLRRQTFTQSTSCRETFKGVRGGCLPPCEVEASPARRQTFVTQPSRETFQEVKEDVLPTCPSPDTPLRRQTYLANPPETFKPVVGGRLPACEVMDSPLRRQTFIKNLSPPCVSQPHTPSPCPESVVMQPSSPSECGDSNTLSQLLKGVSLENTPATPAPKPSHNNPEAVFAYCQNLFERLNKSNFSFTHSNSPDNVWETGREENGRDDELTSPEELMCTAPSTPLSEYESAPSTPPPVIKDNFNVTQEFPTPSIGGPRECSMPAIIDTLEATLSPHSPVSPSPRRLSSGTITKETSVLNPADLITVDSQPSLITPTRDSTHPHLISPGSPYQSEALSELLLYKGSGSPSCSTIGGEIFSPNRDLTLESFAFSPSHDPRRCSTGVKDLPPEELRRLSDKGRQLFFGPEFETERRGCAPLTSLTTSSILSEGVGHQGLSTIEEEEIGGTFTISRTFEGQKNHQLSSTSHLPTLNETHDLSSSTTVKETHSSVSVEKPQSPFLIPSDNSHSSVPKEKSDSSIMLKDIPSSPSPVEPLNSLDPPTSPDIPTEIPAQPVATPPQLGTSEVNGEKVNSPVQTTSKTPESDQDEATKSGLVFIKISPGGCKRPPEGQTKDPWAKRSRIVPAPATASAPVVPQKRASVRRPVVLITRKHSPKRSTATVGAGSAAVGRKPRASQPAGLCVIGVIVLEIR